MAKSFTPNNNLSALEIIQEMTAEFDPDDESRVIQRGDDMIIDQPRLPSGASYKSDLVHTAEPVPAHKAGSVASEARPFAAEIEALRLDLQRLQLAFECTTSIEDHHQLAVTMSLITASIARMVRAQDTLINNRPVEFNRETGAALAIVMKEWSHTK